MDSSALFAMIFGSEKFEPLVGKYGCVYEHINNTKKIFLFIDIKEIAFYHSIIVLNYVNML